MAPLSFSNDFVWGVATAAYQIEGASGPDERQPTNWDSFGTKPGAIYHGHDASVACDHVAHWQSDLDLIAELGVDAYRFSVSWSRLFDRGMSRPNEKGVAFYERLVDGLLERNVEPYLTLFHWDLPDELVQSGGFLSARSVDWFETLTRFVAQRFGDRVKHYLTINEPHAFIEGGLRHGRHAPGYRLALSEVLRAGHHALLAHGRATSVLRSMVSGSWVAAAPVLICATPRSEAEADVEAARAWTMSMRTTDLRSTTWWMDPLYGRGYPEDGLRLFGAAMPHVRASDFDQIFQPLDAVAFNLYDTCVVEADPDGRPRLCPSPWGAPKTAFNWDVSPEGHYWGPLFSAQRYGGPVLITENGLSCRDWVHLDGKVHDPDRIDFIQRHLLALSRAHRQGVDIAGYFHWSLLDNFEWNHGYRERFGLVHVDYQTQKRTPKDSYFAYRDLISETRVETRTGDSIAPVV